MTLFSELRLDEKLAEIAREDAAREAGLATLPCYPATRRGDRTEAVDSCETTRAFANCGIRESGRAEERAFCASLAERQAIQLATTRLQSAGVEAREADLILASLPGYRDGAGRRLPPVPLLATDAVRAVSAFMGRKATTVDLDGGGTVVFTGIETTLVLAGPVGIGKTVAACKVLVDRVGRYVGAPALTVLDGPFDDAVTAGLLVLDDLGLEHLGDSGWALARIVELLSARHASKRLTIVSTNLMRRRSMAGQPPQFSERYGARVDDRLNDGLFIGLRGPSLRGAR